MRSDFNKRIGQLVHEWRSLHKDSLESHLRAYRLADSLEVALYRASHANQDEKSDRRNSHQYRLPKDAPPEILEALTASIESIRAANDFDELYGVVGTAIAHVYGVGHLMIYDTTLRIGSFLQREPTKVYLQSGALDGAK